MTLAQEQAMHGAAQPAAEVSPTAELRRKAEQRLRNKTAKPFEVPADTDARAGWSTSYKSTRSNWRCRTKNF